ncbi:hypothetical protein PROFUN_07842 [Planoprotostelium fungivorum]|uniref:Uncharacterized protein n=1 Tax=Planoprotostelium fungivorum TaxID=1890364 RepID=A0A2P6NLA0_9EUKA|nr:hypothetical protein PROFUN_07842 [Planoprotostelium fungivorum]
MQLEEHTLLTTDRADRAIIVWPYRVTTVRANRVTILWTGGTAEQAEGAIVAWAKGVAAGRNNQAVIARVEKRSWRRYRVSKQAIGERNYHCTGSTQQPPESKTWHTATVSNRPILSLAVDLFGVDTKKMEFNSVNRRKTSLVIHLSLIPILSSTLLFPTFETYMSRRNNKSLASRNRLILSSSSWMVNNLCDNLNAQLHFLSPLLQRVFTVIHVPTPESKSPEHLEICTDGSPYKGIASYGVAVIGHNEMNIGRRITGAQDINQKCVHLCWAKMHDQFPARKYTLFSVELTRPKREHQVQGLLSHCWPTDNFGLCNPIGRPEKKELVMHLCPAQMVANKKGYRSLQMRIIDSTNHYQFGKLGGHRPDLLGGWLVPRSSCFALAPKCSVPSSAKHSLNEKQHITTHFHTFLLEMGKDEDQTASADSHKLSFSLSSPNLSCYPSQQQEVNSPPPVDSGTPHHPGKNLTPIYLCTDVQKRWYDLATHSPMMSNSVEQQWRGDRLRIEPLNGKNNGLRVVQPSLFLVLVVSCLSFGDLSCVQFTLDLSMISHEVVDLCTTHLALNAHLHLGGNLYKFGDSESENPSFLRFCHKIAVTAPLLISPLLPSYTFLYCIPLVMNHLVLVPKSLRLSPLKGLE